MGLFGPSTPFDAEIEKATSEKNTNENWSLILDVCDKVSSNPRNVKDCLKAIIKRMYHNDPHVVMQAITLLDACANNCGKPFHLEIASREFENDFRRLLSKAQPKVSSKMRQVLKNWVENDFKNDPELNLIPSLYAKLRQEGYDFSNLNEKPLKSAAKMVALKDPNVVGSQQEQDDIAKAIELSLKETKGSPSQQATTGAATGLSGATTGATSTSTAYPSLYPSFSGSGSLGSINTNTSTTQQQQQQPPEPRKVRALYDFEAAEENELTFFAGEIIHVLDDTDPNWWKGFNQRGDGLFPSNFVTADMSIDPESLDINQQNKSKKSVKFEDDAKELQQKTEAAAAAAANQPIEVDEAKIDRLLHLLHEANPEDPSQDSDEMVRFEQEVHQMGPLIDSELERVDRKHAQLTQLSSDLVDAINLYHSLMRDDRAALMGVGGGGGAFMGGMPGAMGYQGPLYGAAGYPGSSAGGSFPPQHTQMPQSYASFVNTTTAGGGAPLQGGVYPPHMQMQMGSAAGHQSQQQQQSMSIPMQFQNGHVNSPQNGGMNNALPPHMSSPMGPGHQQPMYGTPQQPGHPQPHPHSLPPSTQQHPQNYQMLAQQHQYSQQQPPHTTATTTGSPAVPNTASIANNPQQSAGAAATQQQQQQQLQQFISPQHQQQQQPHAPYMPQYGPMMNGPQTFMTPPGHGVGAPPGMMQQLPVNHNNNNNNGGGDQFSHMQQQMAAVSMGINQPVTQNFLVQNETKNNIPIYQQR